MNREGQIDENFQEQYERLVEIRNQLDRLSVTQAWSLRETDLFEYQRKLDRIDEARVDGNFIGSHAQPADLHAQRVGPVDCFFWVDFVLICSIDTSVPDPPELCIHLRSPYLVGASIRGVIASTQPAADVAAMLAGGQGIWGRVELTRALSLQHEGLFAT